MYIAYYENRGTKMSSSFGWTTNLYLAKMFVSTHRLSRDAECEPHIDEYDYDKDRDADDIHTTVREMNFYPYTPDVNSDTEIRLVEIAENPEFDDNLTLVTTFDTIYTAVGSNVASSVFDYNDRVPDYSNGFMEYDSTICAAMDVCKALHWLTTGGVFVDRFVSDTLKTVTEVIARDYSLVSYEDFDSIRYCIATGYLTPVRG